MSPRRRLALVALAVVAALLVVGAGALSHLRRTPAAAVRQDQPGPVLLVPGYGGSTASLTVLAQALRAAGRQATVVQLPGDGTGDLHAQAERLKAAANTALSHGAS